MGRPTKCTAATTAIVAAHIAKGLPKRHAYALAGITHTAAEDWIRRGEGGELRFAAFSAACARARAEHVEVRIQRIQAAAAGSGDGRPGDWRADAWLLEKLEPQDFGKHRVELSGPEGGPLQVNDAPDLSRLSDEELKAWRDLAAKAQG